ncbi:hypothetical protein BJ138DRAFT_1120417 [Hygrophoropsis aurantiaca]|uniref:Uncharacterized protein n=1 Tax=Hygrophoropsis aurantiaca TaxID=72124 RepID=A0ACB7ZRM4_9AGAM|nr:hypothetical protein BJ138DRAFT_1120417 [Hygrophoropsis aurantiaca]
MSSSVPASRRLPMRPSPQKPYVGQPSATPSLDAIQMLKRKQCGTAQRTRLFVIKASDDEDTESPLITPAPEDNYTEEASARKTMPATDDLENAVEAAVRRVLHEEGFIHPNSPRNQIKASPAKRPRKTQSFDPVRDEEKASESKSRRNVLNEAIRKLFKDAFGISQDRDFENHIPAHPDDVNAYLSSTGDGPDVENLRFDLRHGADTVWNKKVLHYMLVELRERQVEDGWTIDRSDRTLEGRTFSGKAKASGKSEGAI